MKNFKSDLGERTINKPYAGNQTIAIPEYLPEWSGEAGKLRRQAISMAINREEITKVIFNGARQPAKDFTAPVLDGYSDSIPGSENLKFDATKAKDAWAKADAIQKWDAEQDLHHRLQRRQGRTQGLGRGCCEPAQEHPRHQG